MLDHASNELFPSVQLSIPTSVDALDGAESGIISQQPSAVMKTTSSVVSIEENSIKQKASGSDVPDLISPREEESFGDLLTNNKFIDCTEKISSGATSSMLTSLLSDEKELMVATSISSSNDLSMASVGNDAYRTVNSSKSLNGISGNINLHFGGESAQVQASSPSIIGHVNDSIDDINIFSMETADLYDEVKLKDSCVIPDSIAIYAVSHRINKNKSYRKRIQDALTSRKRLVKAYEQLAIWFGDADMESVHDHRPQLWSPKIRTKPLCDSDWEIL